MTKAVIENYRRGRHTEYGDQFIVRVDGCDDRTKAQAYVGHKVGWTTPSGKLIEGKVASVHGNGGALRVAMVKGLPGQAVGTELDIS